MSIRVEAGDCREVIKTLADNSLHSCVTDPPYSLTSIRNRFGKTSINDVTKTSQRSRDRADPYARGATGFMGTHWDVEDVVHDPAFWAEIYRVLMPGGYLLAFAGTRTYHRMACAIEDAGFEIRDQIGWAYATGFPKSHNAAVGIAKYLDPEWETGKLMPEAANEWQGYSTALKPAWEPICVARKALDGTVAQNVLKWGTGVLNIDGCRIGTSKNVPSSPSTMSSLMSNLAEGKGQTKGDSSGSGFDPNVGRWPANLCHDDSDEVRACFPDSAGQQADVRGTEPSKPSPLGVEIERTPFKARGRRGKGFTLPEGENGDSVPNGPTYAGEEDISAGRFFFSASEEDVKRFYFTSKADASDRWHSKHPTVKPVELMRWLVRLVTPPGGTTLDPFAGSGTTGVAAQVEGRNAILIEREESYLADIRERLAASRGMATKPTPTRRRAKKEPGLLSGLDDV